MTKNRILWIVKGVLVVILLVLIAPAFQSAKHTAKTIDEIGQAAIANIDMTKYPGQDVLSFKRYFGLNASDYDGVLFYRTDDAMDSQELVIAEFKTPEAREAFQNAVEQRKKSQMTTYEGYAPDQFDQVSKSRIIVEDNVGLYVVGEQADQVASQFEAAL